MLSNLESRSLRSHLGKSGFSHVGSLLGFIELVLDLSVARHVLGGSFFLLLGHSLELLDLELELVGLVLEAGEVLLVLFAGVDGLLDLSLHLADSLLRVNASSSLVVELRFEFSESALELLDVLLATLESDLLSIVKSSLELLKLDLLVLLHTLKMSGSVLLLLKVLSHDRGVKDGLLGLILSVLGFLDGFFDFVGNGEELLLELSLLVGEGGVLGVEEVGSLAGFHELLLGSLSALLGLLNGGSEFIDLSLEEVDSSVSDGRLLLDFVVDSVGLVESHLSVLDLAHDVLVLSLGIVELSVGVG